MIKRPMSILALALCCTLLLAIAAVHAAAAQTYRSGRFHYSLSFPTSWTVLQLQGTDFAATSPDHSAFISVSALTGGASVADIRKALTAAFPAFGQPLGVPRYRTISFRGVPALLATEQVASNGKLASVLAAGLAHHGTLYTILGVVPDLTRGAARADLKALQAVLASASFS